MPRQTPSRAQNFLSSVILPLSSLFLIPVSTTAIFLCILHDRLISLLAHEGGKEKRIGSTATVSNGGRSPGCVMISGGRMSKGLHLARAFKRAGWKVIGVEEEGWGELCPMRFSSSVDSFHLLPPASTSYQAYSSALLEIAKTHSVTLFIPVSGAGSSVEDAKAAHTMYTSTSGKCRTFIQDPETMLDCHDKDRFMSLVDSLGLIIPRGKMVESVQEAIEYLKEEGKGEPTFVLKCMGLDENRGDMTLFPLKGDDEGLSRTKRVLEGLKLKISKECPYVFQEFIPGQEYCTHASVVNGKITSFVTCPSNDMLMAYENYTDLPIGKRAEEWTRTFLSRLSSKPTEDGSERRLNGHFSFDFILSTKNDEIYPIECNARVHTAIILLPLDDIARCYDENHDGNSVVRPKKGTKARSWIYNDLIMRYLPILIPDAGLLRQLHPSLPACLVSNGVSKKLRPSENPLEWRVDPSLISDDWKPFFVLWHVYWPWLLITRWWNGKKWTRLNVSTGRIFEA